MKKLVLMSVAALSLICGGRAFAEPQAAEDLADETHQVAEAPTQEQIAEALGADESSERDARRGVWHCTAYAEGHGHSWGFDYFDVHYNHAYQGAMMTCEQQTHHHCHDVHCHFDQHGPF